MRKIISGEESSKVLSRKLAWTNLAARTGTITDI